MYATIKEYSYATWLQVKEHIFYYLYFSQST